MEDTKYNEEQLDKANRVSRVIEDAFKEYGVSTLDAIAILDAMKYACQVSLRS